MGEVVRERSEAHGERGKRKERKGRSEKAPKEKMEKTRAETHGIEMDGERQRDKARMKSP